MKPPTLCPLLALFFLIGLGSELGARTWTSTDGRTLEGDFVSATAEAVTVRRAGRNVTIPLERLSALDQEFVAEQQKKKAESAPPDYDRLTELLEQGLESEPDDEERAEVERLIRTLLPDKGADDEDVEWEVSYPPSGDKYPQESVLISAYLFAKGNSEDRLMWFHIVFQEKKPDVAPFDKFGRYPASRAPNAHLFVTAGRTDVRGVADADSYEADDKIDAVMKAIDLKTFARL